MLESGAHQHRYLLIVALLLLGSSCGMFGEDRSLLVRDASYCQIALVEQDLEEGAWPLNEPDEYGAYPLSAAVLGEGPDCLSVVTLLLDQGADPNVVSGRYGLPALGDAIIRQVDVEVIELLVDSGADYCASVRIEAVDEADFTGDIESLLRIRGSAEAKHLLGPLVQEC